MASVETIPADLEWVKVKLGCLSQGAFESLRSGVKDDIDSYNAILQLQPAHEIKISSELSTIFTVVRNSTYYAHVEFQRRGNSVEIRQNIPGETPMFSVTPIFSNLGRCRWKFNDEELEQWQIRKMALENILFPPQSGIW